MTYETPHALRTALEQRLLNRSRATGVALDRLRRRVLFERILARIQAAEPGKWVLKGGMALEVRLDTDARVTKDIDLGLREELHAPDQLHDRLIRALSTDPHGDGFELAPSPPDARSADGTGLLTWRVNVNAQLAGKPFGGIKLDISPRPQELNQTDRLELPNSLAFADIPSTTAEVVDLHRHAAEKLHAMLRTFGERDNSRVRDLYDLSLLIDHELLEANRLAERVRQVWTQRDDSDPPQAFPPFPESWPARYTQLAARESSESSFTTAEAAVCRLWSRMFPDEET